MDKMLGILAVLVGGGILVWFLSRESSSADVSESGQSATDQYGNEYTVGYDENGNLILTIPGGGGTSGDGEESAEYVPPTIYETQAPDADETQPLGSEENPLYIDTSELTLLPADYWYEERQIEETLGWTEEEYEEEITTVRKLQAAGVAPSTMTDEQAYAAGYTTQEELEDETVAKYQEALAALGGSWQGGALTPPADYEGTSTAFLHEVHALMEAM